MIKKHIGQQLLNNFLSENNLSELKSKSFFKSLYFVLPSKLIFCLICCCLPGLLLFWMQYIYLYRLKEVISFFAIGLWLIKSEYTSRWVIPVFNIQFYRGNQADKSWMCSTLQSHGYLHDTGPLATHTHTHKHTNTHTLPSWHILLTFSSQTHSLTHWPVPLPTPAPSAPTHRGSFTWPLSH